jgi:DNA replication protein DnaC
MPIDYAASLKALQLYGMAAAWSELQAEKHKQAHRPEVWMEKLVEAEQVDRQLKSLRYQLKAARFPIHRDLMGINWSETPLSQPMVEQLASAGSMETAHNLILVGGTGTGVIPPFLVAAKSRA